MPPLCTRSRAATTPSIPRCSGARAAGRHHRPARGVFVARDSDVCLAIGRIAVAHLGFDEARRAYHAALKVVPKFEDRDPIQTAVTHMTSVSDEVYFCAGLMLGVALSGR